MPPESLRKDLGPPSPEAPSNRASHQTRASLGTGEAILLLIGLCAGVLLGPAVLGKCCPKTYEHWFVGGWEAQNSLVELEEQIAQRRKRLAEIGATAAALEEIDSETQHQRAELIKKRDQAQQEHLRSWANRGNALVVTIAMVMLLEAIAGMTRAEGGAAKARKLATARYALMAVWIALVVALPSVLLGVSWVFVALLLAFSTLIAVMPLSRFAKGEAR